MRTLRTIRTSTAGTRRRGARRTAATAAVVATTALTGAAVQAAPAGGTAPTGTAPARAAASPGAAGLGDPLFPLDGNGGYEVTHYTLDFDWRAPRTPFPATATVRATATQPLSRFNLDFAGNTLRSVTVDGTAATAVREGDELVVTPRGPLARGRPFTVEVAYTADPTQTRHRGDAVKDYGWIPTPDGTVLHPQPNGARLVFPSNDHPSRRAPLTFRVTTPPGLRAAANGRLTARTEHPDGRVTWTYDSEQPVAPQLVQLAVGRFAFAERTGPGGLPLRDVVPDALAAPTERYRALTSAHLTWLERRLGPYPFRRYGVLVGDVDRRAALETQTLSLVTKPVLLGDRVAAERVLVHELTHQWTGDSVALETWSDLWLSEGHARFYDRLYAEEHGGGGLEAAMRTAYGNHDRWRRAQGAPAEPAEPALFGSMRYDGSALVLYALREEIGADAFARVERAWVTEYRGRTAGTRDYVALASRVAGRDLTDFLRPWLYGGRTPPMPGHPDWRTAPVRG
ncbi:M1 family metallopeptidase [Streptomyces minutiscleroticus]|uniref:Aminopeptidase N n=1 Tax=Streptomyces minutiscleroticus TaxID=68238 RepID=A0A918NT78_9ACTN|nr:M1 family metallopeptidase [Streptomyces minutiscleroticus]GGX92917.1 zinc metalloprotease [Streptomyces minutiscleroticus]